MDMQLFGIALLSMIGGWGVGDGDRVPVITAAELNTLDDAEMIEGYLDGFNGDDEPGGNRSKSYWHGWRNGHNDRAGKVDAAQRALARELYPTTKATRQAEA